MSESLSEDNVNNVAEEESMSSASDPEADPHKEEDISPKKDGKLIKQIIKEGKGIKTLTQIKENVI